MAFLGIPTSRKDLGNAGWIKGAATVGARTLANAGSITGGSQDSVQRLRGFADAIDDPNQGYAGTLNPVKALTSINAPGTAFNFSQAAPGGGAPGGGGVNPNQQPGVDANGVYTGGGSYDPNTDATRVAEQRGRIRSMLGMFEQAFNDAVGKVYALANEKRGDITRNYDQQQQGLDKNFGDTSRGIDDQFSARNAYHSSFREAAQQQAKDAYDTATTGLGESRGRDLAGIGQFADQQIAEFGASRPNFNVDDYTQVDDLLSIAQDVDAAIKKLQTTGAGLGTNSQYMARLNGITPTQETGSAALKAQLDKLAQTNANPDTKRAIAMTTIANAKADQAPYMDYFEKQLIATGSGAENPDQALVVQ